MISTDLSETTQKSALEIPDKIQSETNSVLDNVQDKIQSEKKSKIFFSPQFFFFLIISFPILSQMLSRTEFCLGLHTAVVFRMQSFNTSYVILCNNSSCVFSPL